MVVAKGWRKRERGGISQKVFYTLYLKICKVGRSYVIAPKHSLIPLVTLITLVIKHSVSVSPAGW